LEVPLDDATSSSAAVNAADVGARDAATGAYYDRLARWTAVVARIGYGGGRRSLTAHRALADPSAAGRPTFTRLHDVLAAALPSPLQGRVLDAGCGLGGTMLDLAARGSATFLGLTLSEQQAEIGRRAIAATGLSDRITIRVASYDSPLDGSFDLVYAIESLAHSPQPHATLERLVERLAPGAFLAIVDDLPAAAARGTADLALFQAGWRVPGLLAPDELAACLDRLGLTTVAHQDLTADMRPRSLARIARLEALNRALHRLAPAALRGVLDSYHGGLALERLYRTGLMSYRLVVARKPV
jgi:27-O-demethylrifamycin SV methyltransferase